MKKKTGLLLGGVVLAGILGFSVLQSFADETEPIVQESEPVVEVASEVDNASDENSTAEQAESETAEVQDNWYDGVLSIEEAKEVAQQVFQGKVIEIELDKDDGRLIYEVELVHGDREAEVELDAVTGEIVEREEERADREKQAKAQADLLSVQEAKEIALTEFPGKVIEMELDRDDGRWVYEVEIINENDKAEIELDAESGEIVELEIER